MSAEQLPVDLPDWLTILRVPGLREPTGISVLGKSIFVADHGANDVLRIDWGEVTSNEPASGPDREWPVAARFSTSNPANTLRTPHGVLAVEAEVLVTDTLNNRVVRLDKNLTFVSEYREFSGRKLCRPHAVDSNVPSEQFIADTDNGRLIRIFEGRGEEVSITGLGLPLCKPCGVCLSPSQILIADTYNHRLVVTDRNGRLVRIYGGQGRGVGTFRYPVAVASWQHWFVVSDEYNKRLQLWRTDEEGDYWTATCVSSNMCAPWLGKPFGVTFNTDGRLFVADRSQARILIIDFEGMLTAASYDVE